MTGIYLSWASIQANTVHVTRPNTSCFHVVLQESLFNSLFNIHTVADCPIYHLVGNETDFILMISQLLYAEITEVIFCFHSEHA